MHVDITYKNQEGRVRTVFYDGVLRARYSDQFPKQIVISLKEDYNIRSYKPEDNLSNVPYVHVYDNVANWHISEF